MVCINAKTHDVREGNVTIRSEIRTKNICSLGFREIGRRSDITEADAMEVRVYRSFSKNL